MLGMSTSRSRGELLCELETVTCGTVAERSFGGGLGLEAERRNEDLGFVRA